MVKTFIIFFKLLFINCNKTFQLKCVIFLTILIYASQEVNTSKILILVPFNGPSHWLMFQDFIAVLTSRGHEVTALTGIKYSKAHPTNYTEVLIDPPYDLSGVCKYKENL